MPIENLDAIDSQVSVPCRFMDSIQNIYWQMTHLANRMTHTCEARKRYLETARSRALMAPAAGRTDYLAPARTAWRDSNPRRLEWQWLVSSIDSYKEFRLDDGSRRV